MNRREFIERATAFGAVFASGPLTLAAERRPDFKVRLEVICEGYDGRVCWFHPGAGAIPGSPPTIVLTMQHWLTARSDVFLPINSMSSADLGRTWSKPVEQAGLGRRLEPGGETVGVCDFTPKWHAKSRRLLGTGQMGRMTPELSAAVERAKSVGGENIRALTLFHIRGRVPSYRGTRDLWERACAAAGASDAGLHDLRSKALTDARRQGKDAQTLGGNTDARMTERYIRRREVPVADSPDLDNVLYGIGQHGKTTRRINGLWSYSIDAAPSAC